MDLTGRTARATPLVAAVAVAGRGSRGSPMPARLTAGTARTDPWH